jgi:hypothetical protein
MDISLDRQASSASCRLQTLMTLVGQAKYSSQKLWEQWLNFSKHESLSAVKKRQIGREQSNVWYK